MRSFITCTLHQVLQVDQIKEDEMGGSCSRHGGCEIHTKFLSANLKVKDDSDYLGVDRRIMLE